jgi:hypothetical protein
VLDVVHKWRLTGVDIKDALKDDVVAGEITQVEEGEVIGAEEGEDDEVRSDYTWETEGAVEVLTELGYKVKFIDVEEYERRLSELVESYNPPLQA